MLTWATCFCLGWQVWSDFRPLSIIQVGWVNLLRFGHPTSLPNHPYFDKFSDALLEEGTAADLKVGGLGLKPGDFLQYVYDFGDWIEHQIIFESIGTVEVGKSYACIVEQNKPKYEYCADCKSKYKQTVARWICITCSEEKQKDILVCESCLEENHGDHWADELTY